MEKILFCCIGAGIAVGGAYFLYIKWQKYQQQCQEENNEVCNTSVNKEEVENNFWPKNLFKKGEFQLRIVQRNRGRENVICN